MKDTQSYRSDLHMLMRETLADESFHRDWTYEAIRPEKMPKRPWSARRGVVADCSKGVQYLCWWAEVPLDPMGMHYGPYGNSETLTLHLPHLGHAGELLVGDIVTFGVRGELHAAMVMEIGNDPLLWSMGHEGAPDAYRLSFDRREHHFLRNTIQHYVPSPADRLREKTGYWSWLQWRLGEGSWAHYPRAAKGVRPHVPKIIPLRWWINYRHYLANRHKGNAIHEATPHGEGA